MKAARCGGAIRRSRGADYTPDDRGRGEHDRHRRAPRDAGQHEQQRQRRATDPQRPEHESYPEHAHQKAEAQLQARTD